MSRVFAKKIKFLYNLQRKIFTFLGDIKIFGWKHPMWFEINAHGYKIRGEHCRKILKLIRSGDILLRRFDGYLSSYTIPGFWNHAGIFYGGKKEQVIHALSEGIIKEDILNFMRTDHIIILRPPQNMVKAALKKARSIVGLEYDFDFNFNNSLKFSCTEVIDHCYPRLIKSKKRFGKKIIVADDIFNTDEFKVVWDSRKE